MTGLERRSYLQASVDADRARPAPGDALYLGARGFVWAFLWLTVMPGLALVGVVWLLSEAAS